MRRPQQAGGLVNVIAINRHHVEAPFLQGGQARLGVTAELHRRTHLGEDAAEDFLHQDIVRDYQALHNLHRKRY